MDVLLSTLNNILTQFGPVSHFYTPLKRQKTNGFQGV